MLKGRILPGSQSVGTVVLHGGHVPSCLQMWVKPFGSHSFKERSCFPEGKKYGRKWDTWELEAFFKSPLVCAPLGPGLAGPSADILPQVFIHSKFFFQNVSRLCLDQIFHARVKILRLAFLVVMTFS